MPKDNSDRVPAARKLLLLHIDQLIVATSRRMQLCALREILFASNRSTKDEG